MTDHEGEDNIITPPYANKVNSAILLVNSKEIGYKFSLSSP